MDRAMKSSCIAATRRCPKGVNTLPALSTRRAHSWVYRILPGSNTRFNTVVSSTTDINANSACAEDSLKEWPRRMARFNAGKPTRRMDGKPRMTSPRIPNSPNSRYALIPVVIGFLLLLPNCTSSCSKLRAARRCAVAHTGPGVIRPCQRKCIPADAQSNKPRNIVPLWVLTP